MILKRMLKIGYYDGRRLHINDYTPQIHEGKVLCEEGHIMIAKKGTVRMHHFCHRPGEGSNCSTGDAKGTWHLWWQNRLLPHSIELRLTKDVTTKDGVKKMTKIADAVNTIGEQRNILSVVEFQNSTMVEQEINLREQFYSRTDLMSDWGIAQCRSELTWVFNLNSCDIEIDHIFGDIICFRWIKGTKYMFPAKARVFYDCGRRDLIQLFDIYRPKIANTKLLGRIISLETFDNFFFQGVLSGIDYDRRLNTHPLKECSPLPVSINEVDKLEPAIKLIKSFYFKKNAKGSSSSSSEQRKEIETSLIF